MQENVISGGNQQKKKICVFKKKHEKIGGQWIIALTIIILNQLAIVMNPL